MRERERERDGEYYRVCPHTIVYRRWSSVDIRRIHASASDRITVYHPG